MLGDHRVAINPLQFAASADGWFDFRGMPRIEEIFEVVAEAGFTAISASPPHEQSTSAFCRKLTAAGLVAGPGYVTVEWEDDRSNETEAVIREAERMAGCGTELVFMGLAVHPGTLRFNNPGFGAGASAERLLRIADHLTAVSAELATLGLRSALHPHVGSFVETEPETRRVLDRSAGLGFGPDIGHLAWARADIGLLLAEYRASVLGVHIKDHSWPVLVESLALGRDYAQTVAAGLWTEPGQGDADISAVLDSLDDPTCWLVIEVDRPSASDPVASIRRCGEWAFRA